MPDALSEAKAEIDHGIEALQNGDRDRGIDYLQQAFDRLEDVADLKARRAQYARLAKLFVRLEAADRGLLAAREAVALDEEVGDRNLLGQDILLCGTAMGTLGNLQAAEEAYRDARRIFIEDKNWANAASATTNIAVLVGQEDIAQGIELLEESLVFLKRKGFPDTEITTRIALIQALVVANGPPKRVFEVAKELYRKFKDELRPDQRENSVGPLEDAIERYLAKYPVPDAAAWKTKKFPMIYD